VVEVVTVAVVAVSLAAPGPGGFDPVLGNRSSLC